jgi:undecaprenyl-diphosphatase
MLEHLINTDQQLLVFLNNLGSASYDNLWLCITKAKYWSPFFLYILFLLQKRLGWKNVGILILFVALLITFTDQVTNLFKHGFQRLRPCNEPLLDGLLREVKSSSSYSFFSGHAANSMATSVFLYTILRKFYQQAYFIFIWPLVFAYSRIYLGLHYPIDILCGYTFGIISGFSFSKLYFYFKKKGSI